MSIKKIPDYQLPDCANYQHNVVNWQVEPSKSILLIHDMQNYFVNFYQQDGKLINKVIANLVALKNWAVRHNVPVVYSAQPYAQQDRRNRLIYDFWGDGITATSLNQQDIISKLTPRQTDLVVTKFGYSAFKSNNLFAYLQDLQRDQIIIGGIYAHIGCMTTALEAFMENIKVFMVGDALADFSENEHQLALKYVAKRCGKVIATNELVSD